MFKTFKGARTSPLNYLNSLNPLNSILYSHAAISDSSDGGTGIAVT